MNEPNKFEGEQPVCFGCREKVDGGVYFFWQPPVRGKIGTWWHADCWYDTRMMIAKNMDS